MRLSVLVFFFFYGGDGREDMDVGDVPGWVQSHTGKLNKQSACTSVGTVLFTDVFFFEEEEVSPTSVLMV